MNLRSKLIEKVASLGVENWPLPGRDDGFSSLCYNGTPFAHFHGDDELDMRHTKAIIDREGLARPPKSKVHPDRKSSSPWIELPLRTADDLARILELVTLTIAKM